MGKASAGKTGKSLVIVESPAKARTISKFLGNDFAVEASIGHIRDLPQGAKEVPEQYKSEPWAYLGVNVDDGFVPIYVVPAEKKKQVAKLRSALKDVDELYLATDEDREGEAISWHLYEVLKPKVPVRRLVFHEITEEAIQRALENPREIHDGLVKAQETRRILDRLYGYEVSPLLWRKIGRGLSAGRVQSVAVRLIVQRERERAAFVSASYWDLLGKFATQDGARFDAGLVSFQGRRVPTGKDFDSRTGQIKDAGLLLLDQQQATELSERLMRARFRVASVEEKPYTTRPAAPFTTSTLQQEANRKLGFTARRTMNVAQSLYENGYITYMRTDSTSLAQVAIEAARDLVRSEYGEQFLPDQPRMYSSKVRNAQEAHEAIRPAGHPFRKPDSLRGELDHDQFRLFDLIWKRTIASQMADARGHRTTIVLEGDGANFQVSGKTIEFPGFLRAYVEGSDDPQAELADREVVLPKVAVDQEIACRDLEAKGHETQPPARYSEAALTRALEELGIGRPSTYASIIDTIQAREYVFKRGNALVPSWTAFSVIRLLEQHLANLVDYEFTAQMEDFLDSISRRESQQIDYLHDFFFGKDAPGLKQRIEAKIKEVDARDISRFSLGQPSAGEHRDEVHLRVGKFGPFLEQGERRASLPHNMPPDELTLEKALELLDRDSTEDDPLGVCPETGKPVYLKTGRFGPYVQLGSPDGQEKPKNASLLKGMTPEEVDLDLALRLLSLPRTLGEHPETNEPVVAQNGRFGPYVKSGSETRSLPDDLSPLDVTLPQALELLATPKIRGRRSAAPKEPLRTLGPSPVTEQPVRLLDGRYGPYVTDGTTNASLPKDAVPSEISLDFALQLLATRAAEKPAPKRKAAKKAATKGTKKKAAPKKTKKTAKKSGKEPTDDQQ